MNLNLKLFILFLMINVHARGLNSDTIFFQPINIYNLYKDLKNIEDIKSWEVFNEAFLKDSKNDYFENLSFFSVKKSFDQIDYEIFSTYADRPFLDEPNIFRRSKDYNHAEDIQNYFFEKYGLKFFFDLPLSQNNVAFTDKLFSLKFCITLEDFAKKIKPNFKFEFSKKVSHSINVFYNWDFFLCHYYLNTQNILLLYYRDGIEYKNIKYDFNKSDLFAKYETILEIIVEACTHTDVIIDGLLFNHNIVPNEDVSLFFASGATIYPPNSMSHFEPLFWIGVTDFIKQNNLNGDFENKIEKVFDFFRVNDHTIFVE